MMNRLRARLSDRKGVAIEMAMLVMVVLFSFSILITTTALLHHDKKTKAETELAHTVAMEQIAYDFCAAAGSGNNSWTTKYPDYEFEFEFPEGGLKMSVKEEDSETVLLCLSLEKDGDTYRISSWKEK